MKGLKIKHKIIFNSFQLVSLQRTNLNKYFHYSMKIDKNLKLAIQLKRLKNRKGILHS